LESALTFDDRRSNVDLKPIAEPQADAPTSTRHDDPEALPQDKLETFIGETRMEPAWRRDADRDAEYYDGNQLRPDTLGEMEERGIPPIIINLTQPIINVVLGMEAKTRSDWEITADDDASEPVAAYMNEKMNEAERLSNADRAISDAYAGQIKAGLHWVEVADETDPFKYPYRVNSVHRREIWWDWRSKQQDLSDARYLIRRRWFDQDVLTVMLPQFEELIRNAVSSWSGFDAFLGGAFLNTQSIELARDYEIERASTMDEFEWRDTFRKRCQLFECWYRKWVRGHVLRLPNNRVIEVDRKNPRHMEIIASGALQPIPAVFAKMRFSLWMGPHRLIDEPSPLPHRDFPYVPFWGFREDLTSVPYGLIRALRSPQDEVNARRSKLLSLLSARRVVADDDALNQTFNTFEDVADEVGRSDSLIVLNGQRKNKEGFRVETNADLAQGQMQTLSDSKEEMHQVSGVFPPTMGDPKQGMSGYAINSLVDQSATTLAEINDNYRFGRRKVGELLMAHVRRDTVHPHEKALGEGNNKKTFYFNREVYDPSLDANVVENSVADAQIRMTLSEVPSTQSYRQQQFTQLAELTKSLPPQVQQFVIDFVIEATDIPQRKKIAERLRKALGLPDPNAMGEEDDPQAAIQSAVQQAVAQFQQQMQELAQQNQTLQQENAQLKVVNANKSGELDLKRQELEQDREIELEKLDLDHAQAAREHSNRQQDRVDKQTQDTQQANEADDDTATDAAIASVTEEVRAMVRALADETKGGFKDLASIVKELAGEVARLKKDSAATPA
jgi:hypothetical protein